MKNKNTLAFTLIEVLTWILIVSFVIIWWFQALVAINIWKVRLIQETQIEKQSFYFVEKFFEMVKKWGTLDYEEYFNRKVVWNDSYSSWHYDKPSWYGNFWYRGQPENTPINYWTWFYYCRSNIGNSSNTNDRMLSDSDNHLKWCYEKLKLNTLWKKLIKKPQRYWQFGFHFIDYNYNYDDDATQCWVSWVSWVSYDLWDEDCDWNIIWDDDDEYLGIWPDAFDLDENLVELYLISWNKKERTFFRWKVVEDPNKLPSWAPCTPLSSNTFTWSCLWTVQYLKLSWEDWWMDHSTNVANREYDWVIDTWLIHKDFVDSDIVAWSTITDDYRVDLFPKSINVSDFKVYAYPNNDIKLNWRDTSLNSSIAPYVRIQFKLLPSWEIRRKIKWSVKEITYSTTINLTDIFSY